jgi:hypothetical protein
LNDEVGAQDPRPGDTVTLHWAAEHSYVIGVVDGQGERGEDDERAIG